MSLKSAKTIRTPRLRFRLRVLIKKKACILEFSILTRFCKEWLRLVYCNILTYKANYALRLKLIDWKRSRNELTWLIGFPRRLSEGCFLSPLLPPPSLPPLNFCSWTCSPFWRPLFRPLSIHHTVKPRISAFHSCNSFNPTK